MYRMSKVMGRQWATCWDYVVPDRVSEPACFGAALAPGIFYLEPALAPALAPGEREHNVGIFLN